MAANSPFSKPRLAALIFGLLSCLYASYALISPVAFAEDFGLPSRGSSVFSKAQERNPFVAATGGRTLALSFAIVIFALQGDLSAAGVVFSCCAVSGVCDAVNCYVAGADGGAVLQHVIGSIVLAGLGRWFGGHKV